MKTNKLVIGASLIVFLNGCIKDNRDDCPVVVNKRYVCFESVMKKYDFKDIVNNTSLYLYNNKDELVFLHDYTMQELVENNYKAPLPLQEAGIYTLLVSMSSGSDYHKSVPSELSGFKVSLIPDIEDSVYRKQSDIYHGSRDISFSEYDLDKTQCDLVRLYKNTNHINITLTYDGYDIPEGSILYADIKSDNGMYDYRNENITGNFRNYSAHGYQADDSHSYYNFTVMHVKAGTSIVFRFEERNEQGNVKAAREKNIIDDIIKIYPTDDELDQVDVFDIEMVLDFDMVIMELIINGWYTIRDGVEV